MFHGKSKIEAIVEGAPAKVITDDHLRAITAKLKAIKLIWFSILIVITLPNPFPQIISYFCD